jgi:hypothetical protein
MKQVNHDFKVGDVLVSTWGYGQTNVDFYLVKELKGKSTLVLSELQKNMEHGNGWECYISTPKMEDDGRTVTYKIKPGTMNVRARKDSAWVKVGYKNYAKKWNGTPQNETKYY